MDYNVALVFELICIILTKSENYYPKKNHGFGVYEFEESIFISNAVNYLIIHLCLKKTNKPVYRVVGLKYNKMYLKAY